jgi:hypothetical protein
MDKMTGYAAVNGLHLYHEVQGEGYPLVLLHGGMLPIDLNFAGLLPGPFAIGSVASFRDTVAPRISIGRSPRRRRRVMDRRSAGGDHRAGAAGGGRPRLHNDRARRADA